jgi:hypothetical protein
MHHPATLAADACVIVGPNETRYCDLATHTIVVSRTPDGAWQPAAVSDCWCLTYEAGARLTARDMRWLQCSDVESPF